MEDDSGCIGLIVGIIVIVIIGALAIQYWYITLLLFGLGLGVYFIIKGHNDAKRRELEAKAIARDQEARRQQYIQEQEAIYKQIMALCESTLTAFESMPVYLRSAEKYLDQAEVDFAEVVFVPFWESIENATINLGRFDDCINAINDNSSRYVELLRKYDSVPPKFPLAPQSITKLGVGTKTAERMEAIVRRAHGKHDFADIYMQFKTNQILVAGFTNLAHALSQMTWQITTSIAILGESVDAMNSSLNKSMYAIHSRMDKIAERNFQQHSELSERSSEREKAALEMLDNIQRGRRPFW